MKTQMSERKGSPCIVMGVSSTSLFPTYCNMEASTDLAILKSIAFRKDEKDNTLMRSISFGLSSAVVKATGTGLMEVQTNNYFSEKEATTVASQPGDTKHMAAVKLQKVYKSFRTRRKLADCAVLVEQSWWKLLDFAELKHSSVSFFGVGKQETAISRWSRARTRAAKVGKGLSKNDGAQKLALQHWLEAIDPRHRYGHNLQFYYDKWLNCQSREPFFYWLDIGEGKEVCLAEKCPRSMLQLQCIKYLGPMERKEFEVVLVEGKLVYKNTQEMVDTSCAGKDVKWIFVLSTSKDLYVGKKVKGMFQHSSFLAGGAASAAGRLVVENGVLKAVWPHSGHYRPTKENFHDFISFLKENNINLLNVKLTPNEEDNEISSCPSGSFSGIDCGSFKDDEPDSGGIIQTAAGTTEQNNSGSDQPAVVGDTDEAKSVKGICLSKEEDAEVAACGATATSKLRRTKRFERSGSYQLGVKVSRAWTSGVGPRISCVRDYPSEIQTRALEEVNLSPRNTERVMFSSPWRGHGWSYVGETKHGRTAAGWTRGGGCCPSEDQIPLLEQVNLSPRSALPAGSGHKKLTVFGVEAKKRHGSAVVVE